MCIGYSSMCQDTFQIENYIKKDSFGSDLRFIVGYIKKSITGFMFVENFTS